MDVSVIAKGDFLRSIKAADSEKEDDIENNLLLPQGLTEQTMARYYFRVYFAQGKLHRFISYFKNYLIDILVTKKDN